MSNQNNMPTVCPLIFASSGGGGHIAAAKGIVAELIGQPNVHVVEHEAVQYSDRTSNPIRGFFKTILYVKSVKPVGDAWEWINERISVSNVLDYPSYWEEINRLKKTSKSEPVRPYVDLLLDLYSFGYEMAAIFNSLQRRDKTQELLKTIEKQTLNNKVHYLFIKARIIELLKKQTISEHPYTTIISTQPQSLGAMCDAVSWYNTVYLPNHNSQLSELNQRIDNLNKDICDMESKLKQIPVTTFEWLYLIWINYIVLFFAKRTLNSLMIKKQQTGSVELTEIKIKQYMTDLPTDGATHFSKALEELNPIQRELVDLYCVGHPNLSLKSLVNLNIIPIHNPIDNPMLRKGFKSETLKEFANEEKECSLQYQENGSLTNKIINADSKVASIMLGSLGGDASAQYIKPLLDHGYDHIFIFSAKGNKVIQEMVDQLPNPEKIVLLGNQSDETIAPIMTRSQCVVTRSGGLSTMEQMALPLITNKLVLIHHKDEELTSGLPWEDGNADILIDHIDQMGGIAIKTCPTLVDDYLNIHNKLSDNVWRSTLSPA